MSWLWTGAAGSEALLPGKSMSSLNRTVIKVMQPCFFKASWARGVRGMLDLKLTHDACGRKVAQTHVLGGKSASNCFIHAVSHSRQVMSYHAPRDPYLYGACTRMEYQTHLTHHASSFE